MAVDDQLLRASCEVINTLSKELNSVKEELAKRDEEAASKEIKNQKLKVEMEEKLRLTQKQSDEEKGQVIEKLRDDKKKLEKACEYLRKKVQWVLDNEQHMREQLILQSVKNAILSKEMKNTKAEIVRLKSERFMADEEMKSVKYLQEQIMQLNSKNAFLTKEMECIANEKAVDDQLLRASCEVINTLSKELNSVKEELAKRDEEAASKEIKNQKLKVEMEEKLRLTQKQSDEEKGQVIEKLRDDKKKLEKACEYLRKKVQWVLDNEQHMREQLILQSVKNAILSKEMKNTKAEIVRLKSERFMADEEVKSVKYLQEQIMQLNSKNAFLTKEMECIANEKQQKAALEEKIDALTKELNCVKDQRDKLIITKEIEAERIKANLQEQITQTEELRAELQQIKEQLKTSFCEDGNVTPHQLEEYSLKECKEHSFTAALIPSDVDLSSQNDKTKIICLTEGLQNFRLKCEQQQSENQKHARVTKYLLQMVHDLEQSASGPSRHTMRVCSNEVYIHHFTPMSLLFCSDDGKNRSITTDNTDKCIQKLVEKGAAIAKSMQELRNQHSIDAENLKQLTEDNRQLKLYLDELRAENAIYQANMQRLLNESWMLEFKA